MHLLVRRSRLAWLIATPVLAFVCAIAIPSVRTSLLRTAGRALVADDAVDRAEIIVVGSDAGGAGVLEAVDLQHDGIATRVAVFTDPPDVDVDREFIRRGLPYEVAAEISVRQLASLGVVNVERIPRRDSETDDGRALSDWLAQQQIRSAVLVTAAHHSRRFRRAVHRATAGRATKVTVRSARLSDFDPDGWWRTRGGVRMEVVELQRLLFDLVRHPIS